MQSICHIYLLLFFFLLLRHIFCHTSLYNFPETFLPTKTLPSCPYFSFVCLFCVFVLWYSPEFSYRPGLGPVSEDTTTTPISHGGGSGSGGGPPNRPLPPTPDDDDQAGDRTLIKRVSAICNLMCFNKNLFLYTFKLV